MIELQTWAGTEKKLGVSSAVEISVEGTSYDSGQLEEINRTQQNIASLLGRLTEKLVENGALSEQDVADILPGKAKVVDA